MARPKPILVTIISQTPRGQRQEGQYKFSAYHAAKIDEIMKNAAKRFNVYTIIAPDGTIIAELV